MRNKNLIFFLSGLAIFLCFFRWGIATPDLSEGKSEIQPEPVRAAAPVVAMPTSTPAPRQTASSVPQAAPQPVPEPPGLTVAVSTNSDSSFTFGSTLPIILFLSTVGLFMGFLILLHRHRQDNDHYSQTPFAVNGAQS